MSMTLSEAGKRLIYNREAQVGVSDRLYWPRGSSGVTLGPGYDMRERSPTHIVEDLTGIGLPRGTALIVASASGLRGEAARRFALANHGLLRLTPAQEMALLDAIVRPYVAAISAATIAPLSQNQFDALVSLVFNIGVDAFLKSTVLRKLNAHDYAAAAAGFAAWDKSGGARCPSLANRRVAEIAQFNEKASA